MFQSRVPRRLGPAGGIDLSPPAVTPAGHFGKEYTSVYLCLFFVLVNVFAFQFLFSFFFMIVSFFFTVIFLFIYLFITFLFAFSFFFPYIFSFCLLDFLFIIIFFLLNVLPFECHLRNKIKTGKLYGPVTPVFRYQTP